MESDSSASTDPPDDSLTQHRQALLDWFTSAARDLPWRHDRTPYRVWISETMLQQTRASTVVPYFERWMARFPDVATLARADLGEVLRMWEGLGYYRRARALHAAAIVIVDERGGRWPSDEIGWRKLPGVGPHTAAAVAALAFGHATIAVDGNVRRVGARLLAARIPKDHDLRTRLSELLPPRAPWRTTEALIELGATVCTPRAPACDVCPLATSCAGLAEGEPARYPERRRRPNVPLRERWARVDIDPERGLWLERRSNEGLLGGLWGFPQRSDRPPGRELASLDQVYSHFRLRLTPVLVATASNDERSADEAGWFDHDGAAALALSRVDRRLLERLIRDGLLAS